jgi:PAN domain
MYTSSSSCYYLSGIFTVIVTPPERDGGGSLNSVGLLQWSSCSGVTSWYLSFSTAGENVGQLVINSLTFTASRSSGTAPWVISATGSGTFDSSVVATGSITYQNASYSILVGLAISPTSAEPVGIFGSLSYSKGTSATGTVIVYATYGSHNTTATGTMTWNSQAAPRWVFQQTASLGESFAGISVTSVQLTASKQNASSLWVVSVAGSIMLASNPATITATIYSSSNFQLLASLLVNAATMFMNTSFLFTDSSNCLTITGSGQLSLTLDVLSAATTIQTLSYNSCTKTTSLAATGTTLNMYGLIVSISSITLTMSSSSRWVGTVSGTLPLPISNAIETSTVSFSDSAVNYFSSTLSTVSFGFGSIYGGVYIYKCGTGWYVTGNSVLSVDTSGFGSTLNGLPSGPYNVNMFRSCDGSSWGASLSLSSSISLMAVSGNAISFVSPTLAYTQYRSGSNVFTINGTFMAGSSPILSLAASLSSSSSSSPVTATVSATQIGSITFNNVYSPLVGSDFSVPIIDPTGAFSAVKNVAISNTLLSFDLVYGSSQSSFCAFLSVTLSGFAGKNAAISSGLRGCSSGSSPAIFFYVVADLTQMNLGPVQSSVNHVGDLKIASPAIVLSYGSFAGTLATSIPDIDPSFSMSTVLNTVSNLAPSGSVSIVGGVSFPASASTQSGFSSFINTLSTIQGGQFATIANMMTMPTSTFQIDFNVVLAASGSFSSIINFQNFPLAFAGVQLNSFQLQQSITPTSVSYSLLIAVSFSISGQSVLAVGQFGFTQFSAVTALGATIQIAGGQLPGVSTSSSSSSSYANLLPGQSIWMSPFSAGPRIGIILPMTLGVVLGVTDTIPPAPAPLQIQFSGGFVIGRTAASVAIQINIPNMQIALAATVSNFNIGSLVEDMVGLDGWSGGASNFLQSFFSVPYLLFSFNPTPNAISVGTSISSIVIPPGLVLTVPLVSVYNIFQLINATFTFNSGGISASLSLAPIVLVPNYIEIGQAPSGPINYDLPGNDLGPYYPSADDPSLCNAACTSYSGCQAWVYVTPTPSLGCPNPTASVPTCLLKSSASAPVLNMCALSQVLNPSTIGPNYRATLLGPTMQVSIPTTAAPTVFISAAAYVFGTTLGLQMTLNQDSSFNMIATLIDPSLINVGVSMNGYTYDTTTWSATITASVNANIVAQAIANGLPVITNAFNNAVNQMNSALSAFNSANDALSSAQNALNDAQNQVNSVNQQLSDAENAVNSQLNCYYSNENAITDCTCWADIWCGFSCSTSCSPIHCSWHGCSGGSCSTSCTNNYCWISYQDPTCLVNNAYYSAVAAVCWASYQAALGTLNALQTTITDAANAALYAAQQTLNSAQAVVSATQTAYQAATNAVGQFAGALTNGLDWFAANALAIQSITLTASLSTSSISGSITILANIGSSPQTWTLSTGNAYAGITPNAIGSMVVTNCQSFISSIGIPVRRLEEDTSYYGSSSGEIDQTLSRFSPSTKMAINGVLDHAPSSPHFIDVSSSLRAIPQSELLRHGPSIVDGWAGASTFSPPALLNVTSTSAVNVYVNVTQLNQTAASSVWVDPTTGSINVGSMTYFIPGTPFNITGNTCYNGICGLAAIPYLKLITYLPNDSYLCKLAPDVTSIRLSKLARSNGALAGPLPPCLAKYNTTKHFSCEFCNITGSLDIFSTYKSKSTFSTLNFANNRLEGVIPTNFSSIYPALHSFNVQNNYLSGNLSFLLNSVFTRVHLDGNLFVEPDAPSLLSTMTALSEYSMIQSTNGIPYVSRTIVSPTNKTRIVVILSIQPNITRLCSTPAGSNVIGHAKACHLDAMPMHCANAYCEVGATALARDLTTVLLPAEGGLLGSINDIAAADNAVNVYPVSATQWLLRYEVDYYSAPSFSSVDLASSISSVVGPGLNGSYSSTLNDVQVYSLCPPGRFGPDCSTFCPTSWVAFDRNLAPQTRDSTSSLSSHVPSSAFKNLTRKLLDYCSAPPSCTGNTGMCSNAINSMNAACEVYSLASPTGLVVNSSSMASCCSFASAAVSACSVSSTEPNLPTYCLASAMGMSAKCAALPTQSKSQPVVTSGWAVAITLRDPTNALSSLFASDSSSSVLNAFKLDVAASSGVLPSQVVLTSLTDVSKHTVLTNVVADVPSSPMRTPSITSTASFSSSTTPSTTASRSPSISSTVTSTPSGNQTPSQSVSRTASGTRTGAATPTASSTKHFGGRILSSSGTVYVLLFTVTAYSQAQADFILKFQAVTASESQLSRGLAAISSAGYSVPAVAVDRTPLSSTSQSSSISGGAIAGIVIAAVVFVALIAFVLFVAMKRSNQNSPVVHSKHLDSVPEEGEEEVEEDSSVGKTVSENDPPFESDIC